MSTIVRIAGVPGPSKNVGNFSILNTNQHRNERLKVLIQHSSSMSDVLLYTLV